MAMTEGDIEEAGGDDYLLPKARRVRQLREELGTGRGPGGDRADGRPSSSVSEQAETAEGAAQTPEAFGGPPPCLSPPPWNRTPPTQHGRRSASRGSEGFSATISQLRRRRR